MAPLCGQKLLSDRGHQVLLHGWFDDDGPHPRAEPFMNAYRGGMDFFIMLDQASFADLFTHGQRIVCPMPADNTANGNRKPIIVGYGTPHFFLFRPA